MYEYKPRIEDWTSQPDDVELKVLVKEKIKDGFTISVHKSTGAAMKRILKNKDGFISSIEGIEVPDGTTGDDLIALYDSIMAIDERMVHRCDIAPLLT